MSSFVDPSGRGAKAPTLALRGVIYAAALLLGAGLLLAESQGAFADNFPATALVSDVGDGLPVGSDVKLRGVLVGRVAKVDSVPGQARHTVQLDIKPEHAAGIPASVKARIIPTNIFGAPSVDLVPEEGDVRPLAEGAVIPADTSSETVKMQTALDKLHDVLRAVQPAKLNSALYNISHALNGQGAQIGDTIARLDEYLSALNPHADTFGENLTALSDALEGLQKSAPALLDTVDSVLPTTKTLVEKENQLVSMLAGGARTSDTWSGFLDDNGDRVITVLRTTRPMLETMSRQREQIPESFRALGRGVRALGGVFDTKTGQARLNLSFVLTPYSPYTAADCPRYGDHAGPNCGGPMPSEGNSASSSERPTEQRSRAGGTVGGVGGPEEKELFGDLLGEDSADLGSLLLGPILRGTTVVLGGDG